MEGVAICPIRNLHFVENHLVTTYLQVDGGNLSALKRERSFVVVDESLITDGDGNLLNAILRNEHGNILGVGCRSRNLEICLGCSRRGHCLGEVVDGSLIYSL